VVSERRSLPTGVATGIGSLPGVDPAEAVGLVFGELPDFPHLPELPGRGPGADLLGRSAALLIDLSVDLQPSGWRMVPRPGRDLRRAKDFLARDLDALQAHASAYDGPVKIQAGGPWTLAAGVELHRGDKVLADPGAVHDLGQSLAEGLRTHLTDLRSRLPLAQLIVQLDEPSLPDVLAARVPTASGYGTLRSISLQTAAELLRLVLAALGDIPVVAHCCAEDPPLSLFSDLGVAGLSLDLGRLGTRFDDALGIAVEAGQLLLLGFVPALDGPLPDPAPIAVRELWGRLGFPLEQLVETVVVTPTCGLAGASPPYARAAMAQARAIASNLLD
jgi:methionine synthase II (cobalamin-independent)